MAKGKPKPPATWAGVPQPPQPPQPQGPGGELPAAKPAAGKPARYTYKDPVRYPVIEAYEGRLKDQYRRMQRELGRALGRKIGEFIAPPTP